MIKLKDKPVLVLRCQHGTVFSLAALTPENYCLTEALNDFEENDTCEIVALKDSPSLEYCDECKLKQE